MQVAGLQAAQGGTAGSRRGDDHSLQSLTQRGLDRRLPAGIDLDQIEKRAEYTVDALKMLRTSASPGTLQRLVQRLGASLPPRELLGCLLTAGDECLVSHFGGDSARLGGFDIGYQPDFGLLGGIALDPQPLALAV